MNAEDAIRLLGHGWRTFTRLEAELVTGVIREQAARIAELEEENAAHVSLLKTYSDRIAELEEKLRSRDCKTEPPTETGAYIVKQTEDGQPWLDIFRVDIGWENAWNGGPVPHSWRPIE